MCNTLATTVLDNRHQTLLELSRCGENDKPGRRRPRARMISHFKKFEAITDPIPSPCCDSIISHKKKKCHLLKLSKLT